MQEDGTIQPSQLNLPDIENLDLEDEAALEQLEAEEIAQEPHEEENGEAVPASALEKPRKPLTPYLLFIQRQKQSLIPGEKFSLKTASETWKLLTSQEKAVYMDMYTEQKKLYDDYVKGCAERGMDIQQQEQLDFYFPSSRIRAIMRQSPNINVKGETLLTMSKAVEYFGDHVLSVVARNSIGKKKIEVNDLWEAINTDKMLWFLRPLVDEWNKQSQSSGRPAPKPTNRIVLQKEPAAEEVQNERQHAPKSRAKTPTKPIAESNKRQLKLTDMYPVTK